MPDDHIAQLMVRAQDPDFVAALEDAWERARKTGGEIVDVAGAMDVPQELVIGYAACRRGRQMEADEVALGENGEIIIKAGGERLVVPMDPGSLIDLGHAMRALGERLKRGDRGH